MSMFGALCRCPRAVLSLVWLMNLILLGKTDGLDYPLTLLSTMTTAPMFLVWIRRVTLGIDSALLIGRLLATVMVLPQRTPQATPIPVVTVRWTVSEFERKHALLLRPRKMRALPAHGVRLY